MMVRKITVIIMIFFFCLGLNNCKSPEEPETYEFRYNVEVIYTRTRVDYSYRSDEVKLRYDLINFDLPGYNTVDEGDKDMDKIGPDRFRCYLDRVYIQRENHTGFRHKVEAIDNRFSGRTGLGLDVQGIENNF